jgi:hypothetical protein
MVESRSSRIEVALSGKDEGIDSSTSATAKRSATYSQRPTRVRHIVDEQDRATTNQVRLDMKRIQNIAALIHTVLHRLLFWRLPTLDKRFDAGDSKCIGKPRGEIRNESGMAT